MKKLLLFINRDKAYVATKNGILGEVLKLFKKIPICGEFSDVTILPKSIELVYSPVKRHDDTTITASGTSVPIINALNVSMPAFGTDIKMTLTITKKFGYYIVVGNYDANPSFFNSYGVNKNSFKYVDFNNYNWKDIKQYFIDLIDVKQDSTYTKFNFSIKTEYNLIRDDKLSELFEIIENEEEKEK